MAGYDPQTAGLVALVFASAACLFFTLSMQFGIIGVDVYFGFFAKNETCPHEKQWFAVSTFFIAVSALTDVAAYCANSGKSDEEKKQLSASKEGGTNACIKCISFGWFIYGCTLFLRSKPESTQDACALTHTMGMGLCILSLALPYVMCCCVVPCLVFIVKSSGGDGDGGSFGSGQQQHVEV